MVRKLQTRSIDDLAPAYITYATMDKLLLDYSESRSYHDIYMIISVYPSLKALPGHYDRPRSTRLSGHLVKMHRKWPLDMAGCTVILHSALLISCELHGCMLRWCVHLRVRDMCVWCSIECLQFVMRALLSATNISMHVQYRYSLWDLYVHYI
jgi:hypothetical protein